VEGGEGALVCLWLLVLQRMLSRGLVELAQGGGGGEGGGEDGCWEQELMARRSDQATMGVPP
jgi:hypothetical protein